MNCIFTNGTTQSNTDTNWQKFKVCIRKKNKPLCLKHIILTV